MRQKVRAGAEIVGMTDGTHTLHHKVEEGSYRFMSIVPLLGAYILVSLYKHFREIYWWFLF